MGPHGPDYATVLPSAYLWSGEYDQFELSPGGYIIAIAISAGTDIPFNRNGSMYRAEFEVTDIDQMALYGTIKWQYQLSSCGIGFPEPIPNFNSKFSYVIKRKYPKVCPQLKITILHAQDLR